MKSVNIAKDIVFYCKQKEISFDSEKIQNFLYFFIGFSLIHNIEEINKIDELPKALRCGIMFIKVECEYNEIINIPQDYIPYIQDEKTANILKKVVEEWGKLSSQRLMEWTQEIGSPWYAVSKQNSSVDKTIPLGVIREYFELNFHDYI